MYVSDAREEAAAVARKKEGSLGNDSRRPGFDASTLMTRSFLMSPLRALERMLHGAYCELRARSISSYGNEDEIE